MQIKNIDLGVKVELTADEQEVLGYICEKYNNGSRSVAGFVELGKHKTEDGRKYITIAEELRKKAHFLEKETVCKKGKKKAGYYYPSGMGLNYYESVVG